MSNIDRAADVIDKWTQEGYELNSTVGSPHAIAVRLATAGLLAPDAPAPLTAANGNPVWRADNTLMVTRYPDGEIGMMISWEQEARYTPQTARDQAALLLAAANYTEEGNQK